MALDKPILTMLEKAAVDGMRKAAREVLKKSRELAPQDDGALKKSGGVRVDDLTVQVSFTAKHAMFQHENLDYDHDDGAAKFLERASEEINFEQIVGDAVKQALNG